MISDVGSLMAAFIGFACGFVGLPLIFFLIKPITDQLFQMWPAQLAFTKYFAWPLIFLFLLIVELGSVGVWLVGILTRHDELTIISLVKIWMAWLSFGLTSYVLVPLTELGVRKLFHKRR